MDSKKTSRWLYFSVWFMRFYVKLEIWMVSHLKCLVCHLQSHKDKTWTWHPHNSGSKWRKKKNRPHTHKVVTSHSRPESTELKFNNSQFIRKFPPRSTNDFCFASRLKIFVQTHLSFSPSVTSPASSNIHFRCYLSSSWSLVTLISQISLGKKE